MNRAHALLFAVAVVIAAAPRLASAKGGEDAARYYVYTAALATVYHLLGVPADTVNTS